MIPEERLEDLKSSTEAYVKKEGLKHLKSIAEVQVKTDYYQDFSRQNAEDIIELIEAYENMPKHYIPLPVPINTLVCVVRFNQHDGSWVEPALFKADMASEWGNTVFATFGEALDSVEEEKIKNIEKRFQDKIDNAIGRGRMRS